MRQHWDRRAPDPRHRGRRTARPQRARLPLLREARPHARAAPIGAPHTMGSERGGPSYAAPAALGEHNMKLRIGRYAFDWWTQFISNIEHRGGVVALGVRHKSGELEILDACAAGDMHQTAQGLLESARRYRDRPGVIVGFLTVDADR